MTTYDNIQRLFKKKTVPSFGVPYLERINLLDTGYCLPGSIKLGDLIIPIITIHVHADNLKYFGIRNGKFEMIHRYRYLDYENNELIQIPIRLRLNRELVLNLDPFSSLTRRFMKEIKFRNAFGFFFICKSDKLSVCNFTSPDEEELEWISRNIERALRLEKNSMTDVMDQVVLQNELKGDTQKKYYIFDDDDGSEEDCFINDKTPLIPLDKTDEYIF